VTDNESLVGMQYLRECFFMPSDGELTWRVRPRSHFPDNRSHSTWNSRYAGRSVGAARKGYRTLRLKKDGVSVQLQAHRVIWALIYGAWPEQYIDHINRDRTDNRIANLRDVPQDVNGRNNGKANGTGLIGAYRRRTRFVSMLNVNGKQTYLGSFSTAEQANSAYLQAKHQMNKEAP
jgi:hypothetical protein